MASESDDEFLTKLADGSHSHKYAIAHANPSSSRRVRFG